MRSRAPSSECFVRVAHDGDDEALLGVHGDAYVAVALEDKLVALELGVDLGERLLIGS